MKRDALILAGDVGGTKTALALYEETPSGLRVQREVSFASREYASLEEIVARFVEGSPQAPPTAAVFGVAGPVLDGRCKATNLPWLIDEGVLAEALGTARVRLLNDLEAAAYGMLRLSPDRYAVLNRGDDPERKGNIAVIGAGTGLGEAFLFWDGTRHTAMASEGGHADFAPRSEQEIELLRFLWKELGKRVSYERLLSGRGIHAIYRFLRAGSSEPDPGWLRQRLDAGDPAAAIAEAGLAGTDHVCRATLDLFCSILGAEAGNLALKGATWSGVFVGGGIAPRLLPVLRQGGFLRAFADKGRFSEVLRRVAVRVALDPRTPVEGAAWFASTLA